MLCPIMSDTVFELLFAGFAGIVVFISFDELLLAAREYGEHHLSIYGLISGMVVMAVSLLPFCSLIFINTRILIVDQEGEN